jgi:LL-diaminopimelate aminotransferase
MAGGKVHETPLREENDFLPKLEDIPTDVAKKAKLFYVCYPNNPTSAVATLGFYRDLVQFGKEHNILIVNDMAYSMVTYDGFVNPTVLQVPGAEEIAIEFHSLSKTFNMTGWRLGFACGNPDAVKTLQKMKDNIDSKQFPAISEAGAYALDNVSNQETLEIYQRRRDLLCDGLTSAGWPTPKPKAGFFIWTKCPRDDMDSAEFAKRLLEEAHIVAIPGNGYGDEGVGYIRMSLTLPGDKNGERFQEAVDRIRDTGLLRP